MNTEQSGPEARKIAGRIMSMTPAGWAVQILTRPGLLFREVKTLAASVLTQSPDKEDPAP